MSNELRLVLVRHGQPSAQGKDKYAAGLAEAGMKQAEVAGDYLAMDRSIKAVFTSSLPRARETAEIIARQIGGCKVCVVPELQEIHLGEWEGREPNEIRKENPELIENFMRNPEEFQIPGGEKLSFFIRRLKGALRFVESEFDHGTVVIVAHRISIAFMICELLGKDPREFTNFMPSNFCAISILKQTGRFQSKIEHFDMVANDAITHAKKTTADNMTFFGLSFGIAAACFAVVASFVFPASHNEPRIACFMISLSSYIRYLLKYWSLWLHIPALTQKHDRLNWALMFVGSGSAVACLHTPIFLFVWGLCYLLVSWKESVAIHEHQDLFHISHIDKRLALKSKLAIVKAGLCFIFATIVLLSGATPVWDIYTVENTILYVMFLWTAYALVRDIM